MPGVLQRLASLFFFFSGNSVELLIFGVGSFIFKNLKSSILLPSYPPPFFPAPRPKVFNLSPSPSSPFYIFYVCFCLRFEFILEMVPCPFIFVPCFLVSCSSAFSIFLTTDAFSPSTPNKPQVTSFHPLPRTHLGTFSFVCLLVSVTFFPLNFKPVLFVTPPSSFLWLYFLGRFCSTPLFLRAMFFLSIVFLRSPSCFLRNRSDLSFFQVFSVTTIPQLAFQSPLFFVFNHCSFGSFYAIVLFLLENALRTFFFPIPLSQIFFVRSPRVYCESPP